MSGAINGELPSIFVAGSGEPGDPYDLSLNDAWAAEVASLTSQVASSTYGAWTSWTPVVTQSSTPTLTNTYSRYARYGRIIHVICNVAITSSGVANNTITVTLPVAAASVDALTCCGIARWFNASPFSSPKGTVEGDTTTSVRFSAINGDNAFSLGENLSSFGTALANGDSIFFSCTYEAAS